jgi:hypothetical protein
MQGRNLSVTGKRHGEADYFARINYQSGFYPINKTSINYLPFCITVLELLNYPLRYSAPRYEGY